MPNILEDLYYGNISPCQRAVRPGSRVKKNDTEAERPRVQTDRIVHRGTAGEFRAVPLGHRRPSQCQLSRQLHHRLPPRRTFHARNLYRNRSALRRANDG